MKMINVVVLVFLTVLSFQAMGQYPTDRLLSIGGYIGGRHKDTENDQQKKFLEESKNCVLVADGRDKRIVLPSTGVKHINGRLEAKHDTGVSSLRLYPYDKYSPVINIINHWPGEKVGQIIGFYAVPINGKYSFCLSYGEFSFQMWEEAVKNTPKQNSVIDITETITQLPKMLTIIKDILVPLSANADMTIVKGTIVGVPDQKKSNGYVSIVYNNKVYLIPDGYTNLSNELSMIESLKKERLTSTPRLSEDLRKAEIKRLDDEFKKDEERRKEEELARVEMQRIQDSGGIVFKGRLDRFDSIFWFIPLDMEQYINNTGSFKCGIVPYIGASLTDKLDTRLRLKIEIAVKDWIFANKVSFLSDNGVVLNIDFSDSNSKVNRKVVSLSQTVYVSEKYDTFIGSDLMDTLLKLVQSENIRCQLYGDAGINTFYLTKQCIEGIRKVINKHNMVKNGERFKVLVDTEDLKDIQYFWASRSNLVNQAK